MSLDIVAVLQDELGAGEHIVWSGQPKQGLWFRPSEIIRTPFSLFWSSGLIFWVIVTIAYDAPVAIKILDVPLMFFALYELAGRFILDIKQREKTFYALTNERIIIRSDWFGRHTKTVMLKTIAEMSFSVNKDGSGTISFGPAHPLATWYAGSPWTGFGRIASTALENIADAKQVHELIRKAQREM